MLSRKRRRHHFAIISLRLQRLAVASLSLSARNRDARSLGGTCFLLGSLLCWRQKSSDSAGSRSSGRRVVSAARPLGFTTSGRPNKQTNKLASECANKPGREIRFNFSLGTNLQKLHSSGALFVQFRQTTILFAVIGQPSFAFVQWVANSIQILNSNSTEEPSE